MYLKYSSVNTCKCIWGGSPAHIRKKCVFGTVDLNVSMCVSMCVHECVRVGVRVCECAVYLRELRAILYSVITFLSVVAFCQVFT